MITQDDIDHCKPYQPKPKDEDEKEAEIETVDFFTIMDQYT